MNIDELQQSDRIIFECVAGSHAYNLSTPLSDTDLRGIYINPASEYLGLQEPSQQIHNDKQDIVYYSLRRFFHLAQTSNPNIIELLWMPPETTRILTDKMKLLLENRGLFISKAAYRTHCAYSRSQISKAKGTNKRVHNPQPEERPSKEDFCYYIPFDIPPYVYTGTLLLDLNLPMPGRPIPIQNAEINLDHCEAAALEHTHHIYRLYHYGSTAKGVFRGDDTIVCDTVSIHAEHNDFFGFLIYNEDAYKVALKEWTQYWDWMKNRNESRWVDQEKGLLNYDGKNMLHCARLLLSGENILRNGEPIVRFDGTQRDWLMNIRRGELPYEEIMLWVDTKMMGLEALYNSDKCVVPDKVDQDKINNLYRKLTK